MRKRLLNYFFQGLFYIAPLSVTLYIIYKTVLFFDGLFLDVTHFYFPGVGFIIIVLGITLLGFLANTFLLRPAIEIFNSIISRLPVIKDLYSPIKDFFSAFVGKDKKFNKPVLVKININSNLEKVGFITQDDLTELGLNKDYVSVYFPHSYAFSGELFIVPAENVKPLNMPSSVAMKFILSGGAIKTLNEND